MTDSASHVTLTSLMASLNTRVKEAVTREVALAEEHVESQETTAKSSSGGDSLTFDRLSNDWPVEEMRPLKSASALELREVWNSGNCASRVEAMLLEELSHRRSGPAIELFREVKLIERSRDVGGGRQPEITVPTEESGPSDSELRGRHDLTLNEWRKIRELEAVLHGVAELPNVKNSDLMRLLRVRGVVAGLDEVERWRSILEIDSL